MIHSLQYGESIVDNGEYGKDIVKCLTVEGRVHRWMTSMTNWTRTLLQSVHINMINTPAKLFL